MNIRSESPMRREQPPSGSTCASEENFTRNDVTSSQVVTPEAPAGAAPSIAIRRVYHPTDTVLSELVDVLCLLLVETPAEGPSTPELRTSVRSKPTCFSIPDE